MFTIECDKQRKERKESEDHREVEEELLIKREVGPRNCEVDEAAEKMETYGFSVWNAMRDERSGKGKRSSVVVKRDKEVSERGRILPQREGGSTNGEGC